MTRSLALSLALSLSFSLSRYLYLSLSLLDAHNADKVPFSKPLTRFLWLQTPI
jgi:hypothetical protein